MKAVKTIAALIFLTALGIVLVQPVLGADDDPGRRKAKNVAHRPEPGDEATPDDAEPDDEREDDPRAGLLEAAYPKRCMRTVPRATSGLVAARRGSAVSIGLPEAIPSARTGVDGDVAWSPSGRYLAESGGRAYDPRGTSRGSLFFHPVEWQWSPVADCTLAVTESGNLTFSIPETNKLGIRLVSSVTDFDLSPNGRRLAYVVRDDGLWIADLERGEARRVTTARVGIAGWFSNRSVLFAKGTGKLRYASGSGRPRIVKGAFATAAISKCRDRTLLTALASEADAPLAELVSQGGRIRREVLAGVSPVFDGFSAASCSPDGAFVVASALTGSGERGPLVLMESDGTLVREIIGGRTANPTWTSRGVVFVKFGGADRGRLWFIPPDGAPVPTAYKVGAPNQYDWAAR